MFLFLFLLFYHVIIIIPSISSYQHCNPKKKFVFLFSFASSSYALCFLVFVSLDLLFHRMFASRNNSASQADYVKSPKSPQMGLGGVPFKPVPPPKPKNYRPPIQGGGQPPNVNNWENGGVSFLVMFYI